MGNLRWIGIVCAASLVGCSQGFQASPGLSTSLNSEAGRPTVPDGGSTATPTPTPTPAPTREPSPTPTPAPNPSLGICSKLDFVGVDWPKSLVTGERKAMALSLNVTGSFEGSAGWANLGNNFDGQGMSLGLSQQNFGQGTLQPLLQAMVTKQAPLMQIFFSNSNLKSMTTMLKPWVATVASFEAESEADLFTKFSSQSELFPEQPALNELDEGYRPNTISTMDAKTSISVSWAKENLYQPGGSIFKTDWKNSFLSLAVSAPYRSLQVNAAMAMFAKASGYFTSLNFRQIRSLLFLYDVVVQNGGFTSAHLSQYKSFLAANPSATETARLTKLMEIRVVSVLDRYKNDVRARKSTIINAIGTVHGAKRDLQKEYCFTSTELVR